VSLPLCRLSDVSTPKALVFATILFAKHCQMPAKVDEVIVQYGTLLHSVYFSTRYFSTSITNIWPTVPQPGQNPAYSSVSIHSTYLCSHSCMHLFRKISTIGRTILPDFGDEKSGCGLSIRQTLLKIFPVRKTPHWMTSVDRCALHRVTQAVRLRDATRGAQWRECGVWGACVHGTAPASITDAHCAAAISWPHWNGGNIKRRISSQSARQCRLSQLQESSLQWNEATEWSSTLPRPGLEARPMSSPARKQK